MSGHRTEPLTVYPRVGAGWQDDGTWADGSEDPPFIVNANIQPLDGEVLSILPEGVRRSATKVAYARANQPEISSTVPGNIGSRVEWNGVSWFVHEVDKHIDNAPIRHRRYVLFAPPLVAELDRIPKPARLPHEVGLQAWLKRSIDDWVADNPGELPVPVIYENQQTIDGQTPPAPDTGYVSLHSQFELRRSPSPWAQTSDTPGVTPETVVRTVLNRYRGVVRVQIHGSRHRILRTTVIDSLSRPMTRYYLQRAGLSVIAPNAAEDSTSLQDTLFVGRSEISFVFTFTKVDDHDQYPISSVGAIGRDEVAGVIITYPPTP